MKRHTGNNGNGKSNGNGARPRGREFRVIVIGASAGGVECLSRLAGQLPPNLPAAVFVVLHISASGPSVLPEILTRAGRLPASHAVDGGEIEPGHIYIAPPAHHLVIRPGRMLVTRGPKENGARPAVDPLFRTAARSYGPWAVGVVLSGGLDDGTVGLMEVKRYGGVAVVQDPQEALFPGMPSSAIDNVQVDYVLPLAEVGPLLTRLAREPVLAGEGAAFMSRKNGAEAPDIAEAGTDALKSGDLSGPPSKFTCPECGGALWELQNGKLLRYRCHVGHGYTAGSLMAAQAEKLEDALWAALRALEENAGMRRRMAARARKGNWAMMAEDYEEQAAHAESRAAVIRSVLVDESGKGVNQKSADATEAGVLQAGDRQRGPAGTARGQAPAPPAPEGQELPGVPAGDGRRARSARKSAGGAKRRNGANRAAPSRRGDSATPARPGADR